jgi:hypothetical protein
MEMLQGSSSPGQSNTNVFLPNKGKYHLCSQVALALTMSQQIGAHA